MKDEYAKKYVKLIKDAKDDFEIKTIIDRIYQDGVEDGHSEGLEDAKSGDF